MSDVSVLGSRPAALAWLAHPISLAGIAVLLLNDHLLKAAFGTWWTGKLSDVAGLVFAPVLVAIAAALIAPRARAATLARGAIVGVGLTFAVVKATAIGAAAASVAWTAITGPAFGTPSVVRHDATDLLALPALALAWWAFTRARQDREPGRLHRAARLAIILPVAVFAVGASGANAGPEAAHVGEVDGHLVLGFQGASGSYWAESADGYHFRWVASEAVSPDLARDCVRSSPEVCYRIADGVVGVESSNDGGATWHHEWGDSPAAADPNDSLGARSVALAVVESGSGYRVFVANESSGFEVRDTDGSWANLVPAGSAGTIPAPLPATDQARLSRALSVGAIAAAFCFAALAWRSLDPDVNRGALRYAAIAPLAVGGVAGFVSLTVAGLENHDSWDPEFRGVDAWIANSGATTAFSFVLAPVVIGAAVAFPMHRGDRLRVWVWSGMVGVVAGVARYLAQPQEPGFVGRLGVVSLATLVVFGLGGWFARPRHNAGSEADEEEADPE